jgi:hypothetical protein
LKRTKKVIAEFTRKVDFSPSLSISIIMLAVNDAKIDPIPKNTHERVCKSCAPF